MNPINAALSRNLIFVSGKGGVGKTSVSEAVAHALSSARRRVLWVSFEDPLKPTGDAIQVGPNLWNLNCEAQSAFEEYVTMKIGVPSLTRVFLRNQVMQYMAKAAPGIHELVLLGKVWYERKHYDHVICDMPSTGYGLAMFQSARNFADLFQGGPIHRDAESMLATFGSPSETGHLIVALPEEMPLRESIELNDYITGLFPQNKPAFLVNRLFPRAGGAAAQGAQNPETWSSPVAWSALDFVRKRGQLEQHNLRIFKDQGLSWGELPHVVAESHEKLVVGLAEELRRRELL